MKVTRKKISNSSKKVKAVAQDKLVVYNYWKDPEFIAELDRRGRDYRAGKTKAYTLPEVLKSIRASLAKKSK